MCIPGQFRFLFLHAKGRETGNDQKPGRSAEVVLRELRFHVSETTLQLRLCQLGNKKTQLHLADSVAVRVIP